MARKQKRTGYKIVNVIPELTEEERRKGEEETIRIFYKMYDQCLKRQKEKESKVVCNDCI